MFWTQIISMDWQPAESAESGLAVYGLDGLAPKRGTSLGGLTLVLVAFVRALRYL